ncbi:MAG TPA: hypothetical protein VGG55_01860 [Candidatus Acidoferrales bacterium]
MSTTAVAARIIVTGKVIGRVIEPIPRLPLPGTWAALSIQGGVQSGIQVRVPK